MKKYIGLLALLMLVLVLGVKLETQADTPENVCVMYTMDYDAASEEDVKYGILAGNVSTKDGISWNEKEGVLTLNGYNGGRIFIGPQSDIDAKFDSLVNIKVRIIGNNTIHSFKNFHSERLEFGAFGISNIDATITGNGMLTIETNDGGVPIYGLDVHGNLTIDGPTIYFPKAYGPILVQSSYFPIYDDKGKVIDGYRLGGNITVKSGNIMLEQYPYIYREDGESDAVTYMYHAVVLAQNSIDLKGGVFVFNLKWDDGADKETILPAGVFTAIDSITAKNASIIVSADEKIKDIPVFCVPKVDKNNNTIRDEKGWAVVDDSKQKIASSVDIYKGVTGHPIDISNAHVDLSQSTFFYDGTKHKPDAILYGLVPGTDYVVSYKDNINAGTATVIVTGKGSFTGTIIKTFEIIPPEKGYTFVSGKFRYKVTKAATKGTKGNVTLVRPVKRSYKKIVIPETVSKGGTVYNITGIGKNAFKNNKKLKNVVIKSKKIKSIGRNAFKGINKKATIKGPKLKKKQQKAFMKKFSKKTGFLKKTMKIKF